METRRARVDGPAPPGENRRDVIQRPDRPQLDPERLDLPPKPKVVEIRTDTYENAVGGEGLEVVVELERRTRKQKTDSTWSRPSPTVIESALQEFGEERIPMIVFLSREGDSKRRNREPWGRGLRTSSISLQLLEQADLLVRRDPRRAPRRDEQDCAT